MNVISIEVGGKEYFYWQEFNFVNSIKRACRSFELSVTETNKSFAEGFELNPGDECVVKIDDEPILVGFIDFYQPSISENEHRVTVTGRSKTCDLLDCSAMNEPGNFFELTLDQIAGELVAPFGVGLVVGENVEFKPIIKFELNQGESPFQAIERLARKSHTLVTDDVDGNLVLTNASDKRSDIVIDKYKTAEATQDFSNRFSLYFLKGQQHGQDFGDPLEAAHVISEQVDPQVTRYRPLMVRAEGNTSPEEAVTRCIHKRNRSITESINITMTVDGYYDSNGDLWTPNQVIWIADEILGVEHEFLLHTVEFSKSESGSITKLDFALHTSLKLPPENEEIGTIQ